jgi:hypothetical protein
VISGVADRVPERISKLVYIDAFAPGDGQAVFDLISPQRRPAMEALVASEGFGWLLPRLRPTPFGHFTSPVALANPRRDSCRGPTSAAAAFRTRASTALPRPPARIPAGAFSTWTAATCRT